MCERTETKEMNVLKISRGCDTQLKKNGRDCAIVVISEKCNLLERVRNNNNIKKYKATK